MIKVPISEHVDQLAQVTLVGGEAQSLAQNMKTVLTSSNQHLCQMLTEQLEYQRQLKQQLAHKREDLDNKRGQRSATPISHGVDNGG